MKAHLLFEQSGTFKGEFEKLGIEAYDYDILNDFGQTDFQIDLFEEINRGGRGEPSIFDRIEPGDITIAFFPCTMFQDKNALIFRGLQYQAKNYDILKKMDVCIDRHNKLNQFYVVLCRLVKIYVEKQLRLIIENPATQPHYLSTYWIPPTIIDKDRTINGDYFKKPTQYWFIGCDPKNNFLFEAIEYVERNTVERIDKNIGDLDRRVARSMIHPQYASRFIRQYVL